MPEKQLLCTVSPFACHHPGHILCMYFVTDTGVFQLPKTISFEASPRFSLRSPQSFVQISPFLTTLLQTTHHLSLHPTLHLLPWVPFMTVPEAMFYLRSVSTHRIYTAQRQGFIGFVPGEWCYRCWINICRMDERMTVEPPTCFQIPWPSKIERRLTRATGTQLVIGAEMEPKSFGSSALSLR